MTARRAKRGRDTRRTKGAKASKRRASKRAPAKRRGPPLVMGSFRARAKEERREGRPSFVWGRGADGTSDPHTRDGDD